MQALMDTHTFLWWNDNDPQLSQAAGRFIQDPNNTLYLSVASVWEIAIKVQTGKMTLNLPPDVYVHTHIQANHIKVLPINIRHTLQVYNLPLHHRDPFDRILIAQAQVENLPILTIDAIIQQYAVQTIW